MLNFAPLRAAVFPLFVKNFGGADSSTPVGAWVEHVFAIMGGSRRPKTGFHIEMYVLNYYLPYHLMSELVVIIFSGSLQIYHIMWLSILTSDFPSNYTKRVITQSDCLFHGA